MSRTADITRTTGETAVQVTLSLDGVGEGRRETGVGFFDHLLDALARHGGFDLDLEVRGDLDTGPHHTVEDTGIALGQALDRALGDRAGIARFGQAAVPMDEALATCAIDVSGRPYVAFAATSRRCRSAASTPTSPRSSCARWPGAAKLTIHLRVEAGTNAHHMVECAFKALARALRAAVAADPRERGVPSTKGVL